MSLKVHFLNAHLDYFPENLGAVSEEQGERFHQDIKEIKHNTREDGMSTLWEITAGCCTEMTHKLRTKEKVPNDALKEKGQGTRTLVQSKCK
jgi:hypothetical protein